jgi:hypothetical protein
MTQASKGQTNQDSEHRLSALSPNCIQQVARQCAYRQTASSAHYRRVEPEEDPKAPLGYMHVLWRPSSGRPLEIPLRRRWYSVSKTPVANQQHYYCNAHPRQVWSCPVQPKTRSCTNKPRFAVIRNISDLLLAPCEHIASFFTIAGLCVGLAMASRQQRSRLGRSTSTEPHAYGTERGIKTADLGSDWQFAHSGQPQGHLRRFGSRWFGRLCALRASGGPNRTRPVHTHS